MFSTRNADHIVFEKENGRKKVIKESMRVLFVNYFKWYVIAHNVCPQETPLPCS
jgi:hypothetical protein